jgi:Ran GTPase-activating protein (RanGAP) involved in mRNA processing and transport
LEDNNFVRIFRSKTKVSGEVSSELDTHYTTLGIRLPNDPSISNIYQHHKLNHLLFECQFFDDVVIETSSRSNSPIEKEHPDLTSSSNSPADMSMACKTAADSYSEHICNQMPERKFCQVQHSHFDDTHARELALALAKNPNVEKLELSKCPRLSAKGVSTILNSLVANTNNISRLDLESVTVGDEGLLAIARLLQTSGDKLCAIQWLGLEDNNGSTLSLQAWKGLFRSVGHLRSLDLSRNALTQDHMVELCNTIKSSKTLESLIVSENPIGDKGVEELCDALQHNESLVLLALGDCQISNRGMHALTQCLRQNSSLQRFFLYGNPIDYDDTVDRTEFAYWLELNSIGRRLLRTPDFRSELLPRMLSKVHNSPELLFGLLHELPHVWLPRP